MHARRARLDHRLHQLEGVERPAEAGLGVGDDRREPVRAVRRPRRESIWSARSSALLMRLHERGSAVRRVEALVGVHLAGEVGVGRDLPAGQVDRLQAGLDHLHGLVAGERAERGDVVLRVRAAARAAPPRAARACARRGSDRGAARPRRDAYGRSIPVQRPFVSPAPISPPPQLDCVQTTTDWILNTPFRRRQTQVSPVSWIQLQAVYGYGRAVGTIARHGADGSQTRRRSAPRSPRRTRRRARRSSSGPGMLDGALVPEAAVRLPLAMMNRHGLIAGATGTGKTRTLQLIAEQLSAAGVAGVRGRREGRRLRAWPCPARPTGPAKKRATELGLPFTPTGFPVEYLVARRHRARRAGARDGLRLRAAAAREGARLERDAGAEPRARLPLRRREGPRRSSTSPTCARCSRSSTRTRARPSSKGIGGLSPQTVGVLLRVARRARDGRRNRVLRRAAVRRRRPPAHGAGRARRHLVPRAAGRAGQAEALLDRAHVAASPSSSSSFPRSATSTSRSSSSSSTRRTCCSTARARRSSSRSMQTVRLIRSKGVGVFFVTQTPKDVPARRARPARQPRAARAAGVHARRREGAQARPCATFPKSDVLRPRGAADAARHRRGGGDDPRRDGRADAGRAHAACGAPLSRMGPADDVDGGREGVAAVREVRHAARQPERAGDARARGSSRPPPGETPSKPTERQKGAASAAGKGADAIGDFLQSSSGPGADARGRARRLRDAEEGPLD